MASKIATVFALLAGCFFIVTQCQYGMYGGGMYGGMYGGGGMYPRYPPPYGGGYGFGGYGGGYGAYGGYGQFGGPIAFASSGIQYPASFYSNNQSETVDSSDVASGDTPEESK